MQLIFKSINRNGTCMQIMLNRLLIFSTGFISNFVSILYCALHDSGFHYLFSILHRNLSYLVFCCFSCLSKEICSGRQGACLADDRDRLRCILDYFRNCSTYYG